MRYTSIKSAGSLSVQIVNAKTGRSPKRQLPSDNERDDLLEEQAPPPPGMGKLVDKTA